MTYTPGASFAFRGDGFVPAGGDYSPGLAFSPDAGPLAVSIEQPMPAAVSGAPDFLFFAPDYTPEAAFAFVDPSVFTFQAQDYSPSTLFQLPWRPATGAAAEIPTLSGALSATLAGVSGAFVGVNPSAISGVMAGTLAGVAGQFVGVSIATVGQFAATLDSASASLTGAYDPNVHRFTLMALCAGQGDAEPVQAASPLTRQQALPSSIEVLAATDAAGPLSAQACIPVDQTRLLAMQACAAAEDASPQSSATHAMREQLTPVGMARRITTESATRTGSKALALAYQLELIWTETRHPVDDAGCTQHTFVRRYFDYDVPGDNYQPALAFGFSAGADIIDDRMPGAIPASVLYAFDGVDYQPSLAFTPDYWPPSDDHERPDGVYLPPVFSWPGEVSLHAGNIVDQLGGIRLQMDSNWQRATRHKLHQCHAIQDARRPPPGTSIWIDPPRPPPVVPPEHVTFTIPDQQVYIMQHALSVTLLDLTPVPMTVVRLSYDADSFAWQFSGQLAHKSALPLVQQAPGNPPVQLIVTINGYAWKVLVERIEHSRAFGERTINLSGHGLTALLGQPYEQPASATQGSALTVQQLADLLMPIGWTINWTMPTWLVPGGAYSYSGKTPIQALAQLTNDIGAMLVPARDSQTINIMPRYPTLPWSYDLATPDLIIPEAAIDGLTERTVSPSQANGVYVHGGEIGGVLAWCRLSGTDGARLAPTLSNALLTDVVGCRALGERTLAGQYQQPGIQSLTLPMDGATFPLAAVGQLAQITVDSVPVRSIINSVQIEASLGRVRQTIQIGEETPNTWAMFKELMPRDPLLVGTLSSTDGATSLMTLIDTGVVRVRGTGTIGNKYYLRSGRIDGDAPNMAQSELVI